MIDHWREVLRWSPGGIRIFAAFTTVLIVGSVCEARMIESWCGGGIFVVDKKSGSRIVETKIPEMQVLTARNFGISVDKRYVRLSYAKCLLNQDKKIANKWIPAHDNIFTETSGSEITTTTFATRDLQAESPKGQIQWSDPIHIRTQMFDENLRVNGRDFRFDENLGAVCLLEKSGTSAKWCYTIDPYSNDLRAGPSPLVGVHEFPEGYLVITNWFGAFLLEKSTGFAKWHIPYSNEDFVPAIIDLGDRLIFFPHQLPDNYQ